MKFIITVDTEADNQWKWKAGDPLTLANINHIPRFHELCNSHGFPVTYLITHEVASDTSSVDILKDCRDHGDAEIGAHLHPWTTPPYDEKDQQGVQRYPHELPDDILRKKLANLTEKIEGTFNRRPTSFRAGKWGFGSNVASVLSDLGYTVDSSVTPKVNWKSIVKMQNREHAPDFSAERLGPHVIDGGIVEIPMTIVYRGLGEGSEAGYVFSKLRNSLFKRILNKGLFMLTWCRIFPDTSIDQLTGVYTTLNKNDIDVMQLMIHSSELMAGGSPYFNDEFQIERMYTLLEEFLQFLEDQETKGVTLSAYAEEFIQRES